MGECNSYLLLTGQISEKYLFLMELIKATVEILVKELYSETLYLVLQLLFCFFLHNDDFFYDLFRSTAKSSS